MAQPLPSGSWTLAEETQKMDQSELMRRQERERGSPQPTAELAAQRPKSSTAVLTRWRPLERSIGVEEGRVWRLGQRWPRPTVRIQMFGTISARPTTPPRRAEAWNFAWREGGAGEAG